MSIKRTGLGRNLSALLQPIEPLKNQSSLALPLVIPISSLQPGKYQPRIVMDEQALAELAESIKKQGLLQPLVVRECAVGQYEIVAGERRWRACQLAGMSDIPVLVRQVDDETAMAMALVENLQREALNAMEQARAMQRLSNEFSLTHQEIAHLLSKSRAAVSNFLRLLHLNPHVQMMVEQGELDMGHARSLLMLAEEQQVEVAKCVIERGLSVRETEALVARLNTKTLASQERFDDTSLLFGHELSRLADQLKTRVSLKTKKSGEGTLIIHYNNVHSLKRMMAKICPQTEMVD